ncbi:hypothetical protein FNF27_08164 [Cafeteria roenbergensis]|uniref:Uncharacterized protein n=1 Tax=Cafeteria roenbergensis TaxID=33653 RepID=A0A5A8D868_CAFRO|nr:hypothetical protein FNF27_08164 [Cafeteria roenbergensis]
MAAARSFGRILDPMLTIRQMSRDLAPRKRVLLVKQYDITVRGLKAGKVSSSAAQALRRAEVRPHHARPRFQGSQEHAQEQGSHENVCGGGVGLARSWGGWRACGDTELERKMEGNPWDPLCWEDVFEATIRPASPTPGRKVRIFLIVDEFQELFKFDPLGHRFRTQLTALMNGLEDFEIFVMGTPTVGRQVLLNPGAMQDDPRIVHYPGLVGQVASVNITKISQPARLNRFSGDEAVHFLLSCLPELKESTLSDIPGIVNELRGKLHAEPPAIGEQLDKLRQCPAWKRLTSVFDELRPTARAAGGRL